MCKIFSSHFRKNIFLQILPVFFLALSYQSFAQRSVSGRVLSGDTALAGVSVFVKGTSVGTITDEKGMFSIEAPSTGVLVFTFTGYASREIDIRGQSTLVVQLGVESSSLSEVVVVAYGNTTRKTFTGSLQTVKAEELQDLPVTQFTQKLQGRLSGVQIQQTTGVPGAGMSVRIRGAASIGGGTQPLYVVDGFPITGDINNINPDEIESFTILKDASATSLYGSRAANGVVIIQTKKAKAGQSSISFHSFYGIQQVPDKGRPDMMNAEEFAQYQKEVYEEKIRLGQAASIPAEYQNPSQYRGRGTDWYDLLLRDAPIQNYSLTMSSSKERLSTSAVLGYINQEGVLLNSNYKRYSLRLNSDYKFNERITAGVNIAPSYATSSTPNADGNIFGGGIIQSAIATSPIAPHVNSDGSLPLTATSTGLFPNPNWYRVVQEVKNNTRTARVLSNAYINVEIIRNLNFRSSLNIDYTSQKFNNFTPSTAGSLFSAPPIQTRASESKGSNYSWLTENILNYRGSLKEHDFDVLAGYTAQRYYGESSTVNASGFPNDRIQTLNAGSVFTTNFSVSEWTLVSFVSRINYSYKNKYLLTASFRRDGSSRFAPNKKYGNFPSISAGWNVTNEEFLANTTTALSFLKIRAGYGLNGNFNIGDYSYLARTTTTNYAFNNALSQGTTVSSIGNRNLSWEKSKQLDIGADIGFFKDRIFITYDYFHKITSGMLFNVGIPQQSGFGSIADNVGEFDFKGHEFSVTSQNLVGQLKWTTNFNIAFIKNKVVNLGPYDKSLPRGDANGPNITIIGSPIGSFYGYSFLGVYVNQQDLDNSPQYLGGDSRSAVGTVKYADINGDKQITPADKTIIGDPNPDFIYGMSNDLSYKNFDFSIVISGQYGFDIQNRTLEYIQNLDGVFNVTKDVARRWKSPSDPGDGVHPRAVVSTPLARNTNSRWVTDGSFLTVKNITLGYTVPLTNNYIKGLRLYGGIQQALVLTNYKGANPEVNDSGTSALVQGIDYTSYPVPRTYTFGVSLTIR